MTVTGNIDIGDVTGFLMYGIDCRLQLSPGQLSIYGANFDIEQSCNKQSAGFDILPNIAGVSGQIVVRDNKALGARYGFWVYPGSRTEDEGVISAGNVQLVNNIAVPWWDGFLC